MHAVQIKNFVDDKSFSAADNDRRLMVASVAQDASLEAVTSMMTLLFPDHKDLLLCQIENEVIRNPIAMVLTGYCLQREHFLNSKKIA